MAPPTRPRPRPHPPPLLRYVPPLLWGKSGHLQTALYGKMGRINTPAPRGVRRFLLMPDGATATFDLFEPLGEPRPGGNKDRLLARFCKPVQSPRCPGNRRAGRSLASLILLNIKTSNLAPPTQATLPW